MPIPAPLPTLDTGEELVGDGNRLVTVGFIDVKVYRLALYADVAGMQEVLHHLAGCQLEELRANALFYQGLIEGRFSKVFQIDFLRSIPADKCRAAFEDALLKRTSAESAASVQELISVIPDVKEASRILVQFDANGEDVTIDVKGGSCTSIRSTDLWTAFQDVYFGENSEMKQIKSGAVQRVPQLLGSSTDTAVTEVPEEWHLRVQVVSATELGKPEYRLGDFTTGLIAGSHQAGYVQLTLGDTTYTTATREGADIEFHESLQEFRYQQEELLKVEVYEKHTVKAAIRGDAIIGEGHFLFDREVSPFLWKFTPPSTHRVEVPLERKGNKAGLVTLDCQLVPPDSYMKKMVEEQEELLAVGEKPIHDEKCAIM